MALFVVRHQHAAERWPAQDPYTGAMLLNHLSRPLSNSWADSSAGSLEAR